MIIADKIITLRKNNGWSQEELAEKLEVSRQSVSKWESANSIPDINRIIQMAQLFSVTTDYLLKEELEIEEYTEDTDFKKIQLNEATTFIQDKILSGKKIAVGTVFCILSPVLLILLTGLSSYGIGTTENVACIIGLISLAVLIMIALVFFISDSTITDKYKNIKNANFELEFGLKGILTEKYNAYLVTYRKLLILGIGICILSVMPLIICAILNGEVTIFYALTFLFFAVSIGVYLIMITTNQKSAYEQLLLIGSSDPEVIKTNEKGDKISSFYWILVTTIYLGWSFLTNNWGFTWIVWPIATLIFAAISVFIKE